jgi:hypothetical protein
MSLFKTREQQDKELRRRFEMTTFVVEATSCETQMLWERTQMLWERTDKRAMHDKLNVFEWQEIYPGFMETIAELQGRPITIAMFFYVINSGPARRNMVMFWEATSEVVDYKLCREWLEKQFANRDDVTYTDAMNFHQVLNHLRR